MKFYESELFLFQGTGANYLGTGVYFTFLLSFLLLVLTTAHFLIGATLEKVRLPYRYFEFRDQIRGVADANFLM